MADAIRFVSAHWVLHMKANRHESARAWVQAWARRWGFVATKTSSRTSQVRQFPLQLLALEDRLTPTVDLTYNLLAGWTPITPANGQHDFVNDQQTGSGSLPQDIVGNNNHRAAYLKYDTGTNSGSTSDDYVAFRIRVNGTSDSTNISDGFTSFGFLGADANGDGAIDFFIGAYKPHATNGGRIGIYDADGSAGNTGPSTTGIAGSPTVVYTSSTAGYGDLWRFQVVGDSSNFAIDPDYLLSFQISVADINANLSAFGLSNPSGQPLHSGLLSAMRRKTTRLTKIFLVFKVSVLQIRARGQPWACFHHPCRWMVRRLMPHPPLPMNPFPSAPAKTTHLLPQNSLFQMLTLAIPFSPFVC